MAMHKVPTLVLGIGGIGCRIAANISDLLTPEARERVAVVGIDTNVNDLKKLSDRGIRTIQTSDDRTVGEYLQAHPEHLPWFPLNRFTASKSLLNGAGQIRAVSRLGALAAVERGSFIALKEEIQRIRKNRGDESNGNLTVMVVGSITGGTGAGLFLQIPYYIRKIMKGEAGLNSIIIRGMFVGPDLTVDVQPSPINRDAVRVNGYACIKELNAMYMRQLPGFQNDRLKVDFYTPNSESMQRHIVDNVMGRWDALSDMEDLDLEYDPETRIDDVSILAQGEPEIPYNYLYLIEGSNADGGIGNATLDSVESLAAHMVHTLMFTPVSNNALSVEDNMVLQDALHNGMNRYSSAGMTRLIYPQEQAREYVTLCTVRDLVREEWMIIDDSFRNDVIEARSLQRTDGHVEIPQLKTAFRSLFYKQVKGEGRLGKLYHEAFVAGTDGSEISRATIFLKGIDSLVKEVIDSTEVANAVSACGLNDGEMNSFSSAVAETSRIYSALDDYAKKAKLLAAQKPAAIANELFPPSVQSMRQNKNQSRNIYRLLHNVHPLTARFLCYDLIHQLEERIKRLNGTISGIDLDDYLEEDFDPKEEGNQDANQYLQKLQDTQNPIFSAIGMDAGKLRKVKVRLRGMADDQCDVTTQYLKASLDLSVSQILLGRLEKLAEHYHTFFKSIGVMIQENNARIEQLENLKMPLGQLGIYCSRDAFRIIASEYRNAVDSELPPQTKTAIFESLFKVLAQDFEHEGKLETERQKIARTAKKTAALNDTFYTAVVATIRNDVIKKGVGIVDMNIREAIDRQFHLDAPELDDFNVYLQGMIQQAMKMAAPMLATSGNAAAENTATAYLAIHPDCAATIMSVPNAGATQEFYAPEATDATGNVRVTALLDESFSRYEIVCFRARYKFSVEDLTKYNAASENALKYRERIANLGKVPVNTGNPDDCLTVINPHLDRYWHEEAFLPAIYKSERTKDRLDTYKAFIYAMGMDLFVRMADENTLDDNGKPRMSWYYNTRRGYRPVTIRKQPIGNSYNDLFNALPFNRRIKHFILQAAKRKMLDSKGYHDAEELYCDIMKDTFIEDLIQSKPDEKSQGDENILDILLHMRNSMTPDNWQMLFTGLVEVLWEYCSFLFDKSERMVNNTVRTILTNMEANSQIAGMTEQEMDYGQTELHNQIGILRSLTYKRS